MTSSRSLSQGLHSLKAGLTILWHTIVSDVGWKSVPRRRESGDLSLHRNAEETMHRRCAGLTKSERFPMVTQTHFVSESLRAMIY